MKYDLSLAKASKGHKDHKQAKGQGLPCYRFVFDFIETFNALFGNQVFKELRGDSNKAIFYRFYVPKAVKFGLFSDLAYGQLLTHAVVSFTNVTFVILTTTRDIMLRHVTTTVVIVIVAPMTVTSHVPVMWRLTGSCSTRTTWVVGSPISGCLS